VRYRAVDEKGTETELSLAPSLACEVMEEVHTWPGTLGIPGAKWQYRVTSYKPGEPDARRSGCRLTMSSNGETSKAQALAYRIPGMVPPGPQEPAFGVDDSPLISFSFPVLFSEWVTSAEIYWSTLAKRPGREDVDHHSQLTFARGSDDRRP
jgi:hypothetical protein